MFERMIKHFSHKKVPLISILNLQFIFSIAFGWFILGSLWNHQLQHILSKTGDHGALASHCSCASVECPPCPSNTAELKNVIAKNAEVANGFYRSSRHKPNSFAEDETNRWRLLTKKFNYEMINQEPRVGINGMWKWEVDEVDERAQFLIKAGDTRAKVKSGFLRLQDVHRHLDPFRGVVYKANYEEKDSSTTGRPSVEMWRPFIGGKPRLIDAVHADNNEVVNIISPLSKVTDRFRAFLERFEADVLRDPRSGPIRVIFVVFQVDEADNSVIDVTKLIDKLKARNPSAVIDVVPTSGEFNRAVGLHAGVEQCGNDEIVLFLDVDLKIGADFLGRIRRNTVRHEQVVFPIMFSQYDPDVMDAAARLDPDLRAGDKMAVDKDTGFWIHYAYGVAAMYKCDYLEVGGFRLDIRGWGGEDVDLFKKMVADKDLRVMSTVDPDLVHIYHRRGCDATLAPDQYAMCVGAWSETLGSQRQVAALYLDSHGESRAPSL